MGTRYYIHTRKKEEETSLTHGAKRAEKLFLHIIRVPCNENCLVLSLALVNFPHIITRRRGLKIPREASIGGKYFPSRNIQAHAKPGKRARARFRSEGARRITQFSPYTVLWLCPSSWFSPHGYHAVSRRVALCRFKL